LSCGGPCGCCMVVCITIAWLSMSLSHHHPHHCWIVVHIVVEVPSSHHIVTLCGGLVMRWRVEVFHMLTFMVPYLDLLVLPWVHVVVLSHCHVTLSHHVGITCSITPSVACPIVPSSHRRIVVVTLSLLHLLHPCIVIGAGVGSTPQGVARGSAGR
jgi:hypothetical protein